MNVSTILRARRGIGAVLGLVTAFHAGTAVAQGTDRWVADEAEARAALPAPRDANEIAGASLSCAAQRWTLKLDPAEGVLLAGGAALISVDGQTFDTIAAVEDGGLGLRVPRAALEPLKGGLRLEITVAPGEGAALAPLVFGLRGSRVAITAVEDRCTLRDMSAYQAVTLTPYSSHLNLAKDLRKGDIEAFSTATASQPQVTTAMVELGEGRRLLFTRLCGSSWYYGLSGCNITGFAPMANGEGEWRQVYDTENVHLHLDRQSLSHGWPDIVTLPVRSAGSGLVWRWNGRGYELKGELPDDEDVAENLRLRPAHD